MYMLEKEKLLYDFMDSITVIEDLLRREEFEELESCLRQRYVIISQIDRLDEGVTVGEREKSAEEFNGLLKTIVIREKKLMQLLEEKKCQIEAEMNKLHSSKRVSTLYSGKQFSSEGYFIDRKLRP
ncbi:flagellar protein FliT [Ammoniphilus sp. YIM 78166]|uniref:flagellar protein FliT n=1 Tax=Ammoniphilus sp. YIM 78166 TaxID=1644106 RepID=UPI0010703112|nr:flagellar protein FliT [Ammoniphilus sp. YIM 78166]